MNGSGSHSSPKQCVLLLWTHLFFGIFLRSPTTFQKHYISAIYPQARQEKYLPPLFHGLGETFPSSPENAYPSFTSLPSEEHVASSIVTHRKCMPYLQYGAVTCVYPLPPCLYGYLHLCVVVVVVVVVIKTVIVSSPVSCFGF